MNAHVFRRVAEALASQLMGARLEKIHALSEGVTQWAFFGQGSKYCLMLRAHRRDPCLFTAVRPVAVGAPPPMFVMRLRKYLAGQRVTAVRCHWVERQLWLRFTHEAEVWLCLDLREGPSLHWQAPPDPELPQWPTQSEALAASLAPAAHAHHTEPQPGSPSSALSDWRAWPVLAPLLRRTLPLLDPAEQAALLCDLELGGGDVFVYDNDDEPATATSGSDSMDVSAWPLPEPLRRGRREQCFEDPLAAMTVVGAHTVLRTVAADAARQAAKPHSAEAARLRRLLEKLEREHARLTAMAAQQADALALQAVLYTVDGTQKRASMDVPAAPAVVGSATALPDGAAMSSATRFEAPPLSDMRTLILDPRLTVRENMSALFHQAGRGRRGLAMLEGRRDAVRAELAQATAAADLAQGMAPACGLGRALRALPVKGKLAARSDHGRATAAPARSMPVQSGSGLSLPKGVQAFRSSDGLLMLRGRDAKGNLAALKLARPDDLWLHAEGMAGAHVILKMQHAGQAVPERSVQEAAVLAALKSPFKDAGTALVQCALARHVHPMRGARPGTVRVDKHEPGVSVRLMPELETQLMLT